MLDSKQRQFWNENGFLVIPGFFEESETELIASSLERAWNELDSTLVVDDLKTGRRLRAIDVPEEDRKNAFKVNDLYLELDEVRRVCLSARVGDILTELLEDEPVLVNTLNLERGSQQDDHVDSLYMTPRTPGHLAATWMALEDVLPDAGPLRYYPGSHRIEQYRFSDGTYHALDGEMPRWAEHMAGEVERSGLEEQRFLAKKGDLFIWHAHLLHGGSEICDPSLTRNSLVSHFWSASDCRASNVNLQPLDRGYWYDRPPQAVPSATPVEVDRPADQKQTKRSLWDRLRARKASDD